MPGSGRLRLAEAAGVLSLATDLAMGQPLEHGLRTAVLGVRTAAALGLPEQDRAAVFYTGMLHFAGCTAGSELDARVLGDELAVRPDLVSALYGPRLGLVATAARAAHPGRPPAARAAAMARSAAGGLAEFRRWAASHCEVAELLGARMGLTEQVQGACGVRMSWAPWAPQTRPPPLRGPRLDVVRGPSSALTPSGIKRTEEDDGCIYVLPVQVPLDLSSELTCDWRDATCGRAARSAGQARRCRQASGRPGRPQRWRRVPGYGPGRCRRERWQSTERPHLDGPYPCRYPNQDPPDWRVFVRNPSGPASCRGDRSPESCDSTGGLLRAAHATGDAAGCARRHQDPSTAAGLAGCACPHRRVGSGVLYLAGNVRPLRAGGSGPRPGHAAGPAGAVGVRLRAGSWSGARRGLLGRPRGPGAGGCGCGSCGRG
jgi:hypothetical protein